MLDELGVDPSTFVYTDDWNDTGVIRFPAFMDDFLIDQYRECWEREHGTGWPAEHPGGWTNTAGWTDPTPYMRHHEIRDLCAPISRALTRELDGAWAVHLNLTGFVTTTRDWHTDSYLNPPHVGDSYAAVWLALEHIDPDSGPFQYVPGSHRWPQITRETIWDLLDGYKGPDWPTRSETVLTPIFEAAIEARRAQITTYLPARGDLLVWHGRLLHRGSKARVPGTARRAFIAHFSRVDCRDDFPKPAIEYEPGAWLFPLP